MTLSAISVGNVASVNLRPLIEESHLSQAACHQADYRFSYENMERGILLNMSFSYTEP